MTNSALDAAEKRAHEAVDRIESIYSSAKRWHVVGTRAAHATIRDLRREAFRAGLEAMKEQRDDARRFYQSLEGMGLPIPPWTKEVENARNENTADHKWHKQSADQP